MSLRFVFLRTCHAHLGHLRWLASSQELEDASSGTGLATVCPAMESRARCHGTVVIDKGSQEPSSQRGRIKLEGDLPTDRAANEQASQLGAAWLLATAEHKCQISLNLDSPLENVLPRVDPGVRCSCLYQVRVLQRRVVPKAANMLCGRSKTCLSKLHASQKLHQSKTC